MTEAGRLFDILEDLGQRLQLPDRMIGPLFNAALGYVIRRSTYCKMTDISEWQASKDLKRLADTGLLSPKGEKRGRLYVASDRLRGLRERSREPRGPIEDPFAA